MPRLSVDLDVFRRTLVDASLGQVGDAPLIIRLEEPATIGRLAVGRNAEVRAQVLNGADDRDAEGVFSGDARAHIPFETQSAWVKTTLSAKATGRLGFGAPSASAARHVRMSDYRHYPATEGAVRAIRRNLESFRALSRIEDVRRLKPGEAVSLDVDGTLSFGVRLSWPDVLVTRGHAILSAIGITGPVVVRLRRDAGADAAVRVQDRFSLVISRNRDGRFRFTVRKGASHNHSISLEASLGGGVDATPVVEEALDPLFEAIAGASMRTIEGLAVRLGADRLSGPERDLIAALAGRLGIAEAHERGTAVRAAVAKLEEDLRRELEKSLRWKAAAGFAYEYARIEQESAIVDYVLNDESLLAADHAAIVAGDLGRLAGALRGDLGARSIVQYLNESSVSRRSSSGFSLGLGKWIDLRARDESAFRMTTRTSLDGFRLLTCRGTRKYSEQQVPENDFEWTVDLKAQMQDYRERPVTRDFDFGLHVAAFLERDSLERADLERMLDFAAMWGVAVPAAADLAEAVGRKATVEVELLFDRDELAKALAAADQGAWAEALAAAMPYMAGFPERSAFEARKRVYVGAWRAWLRGEEHPAAGWAAMLRPRIDSGLRLLEDRALPGSFAWTAGEGHVHLRDRLASFRRGLTSLEAAMRSDLPPAEIGAVWDALRSFWGQRLTIAATGNFLLAAARSAGVEVNRAMRVELEETAIVV